MRFDVRRADTDRLLPEIPDLRRDGRAAEGARLESVYTGNRIVGSNPTPSAISCRYGRDRGGRNERSALRRLAGLIAVLTGLAPMAQ